MIKLLLTLMLLSTSAIADLEYTWTAPTEGGSVEYYEAQRQSWRTGEADTNQTFIGAFEDTVLTMPYVEGYCVQVRVRGVGKFEATGPWSPWSDVFCGEQSLTPGFISRPKLTSIRSEK